MKKSKRSLNKRGVMLAASSTLIISSITPFVAEANTTLFKDVPKDHSHADGIYGLNERGIINGYPDNSFLPYKTLSRSDVVKMLGRFLVKNGQDVPTDYKTNMRYRDLTPTSSDELLMYAAVVKEAGVFNGDANGNLSPFADMTRQNIALVLIRTLAFINDMPEEKVLEYIASKNSGVSLADIMSARAETRPYILALKYFGLTVVDNYRPNETTARGQYASFLHRMITLVMENNTVTADLKRYKDLGTVEFVNETTARGVGAQAGQLIVVYDNANTEIGRATVGSNGQYALTMSKAVQPGDRLTMVVDRDGNLTTTVDQVRYVITVPQFTQGGVNKRALAELIADGLKLVQTDYTAATWTTFVTALTAAQAMNSNAQATQSQVDSATTALQTAINGLVRGSGTGGDSGAVTPNPNPGTPTTPYDAALNAVVAAENATPPSQTLVDTAWTLVNALTNGSQKDGLSARLNVVQGKINYNVALFAVVTAEGSPTQGSIDAARTLVNALPNSDTRKAGLLTRLTAVQQIVDAMAALKQAEEVVVDAETTPAQILIDVAQTLVTALPNNDSKTALQTRLDAVQVKLNAMTEAEKAAALLQAAKNAVTKAELNPTQLRLNLAQSLVTALPTGTDKAALQGRVDVVAATVKVVTAETLLTQVAYNDALTVVNALPNSAEKTALLDRLAAVLEEINGVSALAMATRAVETAEANKIQSNVDAAKVLVDALPASAFKTALLNRLQAVQEFINANGQLATATAAVVEAETELTQAKHDAAKALVDALPNSATKTSLLVRLEGVKAAVLAKAAVEKAEASKLQADVTAAQALVDGLPFGDVRTELTARLFAIQQVIDGNNLIMLAQAAIDLAEAKVNTAVTSGQEADVKAAEQAINLAQTAINKVLSGPVKTSLEAQLLAIEQLLHAAQAEWKVKEADDAVKAAIQSELANAAEAVLAGDVVKAEQAIAAAQEAINKVTDATKKTAFTNELAPIIQSFSDLKDRLTVAEALAVATASIVNAETVKTSASVTAGTASIATAKTKIDALADSPTKTDGLAQLAQLEERLEKVAKYVAAYQAVVKAERSQVQSDVDAARALVDVVEDGADKTALLARLVAVQNMLNYNLALFAVQTAEVTPSTDAVTTAQALIDKLADDADKAALQARIDTVSNLLTRIEAANAAVALAETTTNPANVQAAQDKINVLPANMTRTALQNRLNTALAAYSNAKTLLEAAVFNADSIPLAKVSTDGRDVATTDQWVTQAEASAFATALQSAKSIWAETTSTTAELTAAATALNKAATDYTAAKKAGTSTTVPQPPNFAPLQALITTAEGTKANIVISTDGSDVVPPAKWVTAAVNKAFDDAVAAAKAVAANQNATQADIDAATTALQAAIDAYVNAQKAGTQQTTPTINKTNLNNALTEAQSAKLNVEISANGSDIAPNKQWVTQGTALVFDAAIAAAVTVVDKADASQADVDAAVETLQAAITTYKAAVKKGTLDTALQAAIDAVVAAETANLPTQGLVDTARNLVSAVANGQVKTELGVRLDAVQLIVDADVAVTAAEAANPPTLAIIDATQLKINLLPFGAIRDGLQARLDVVQQKVPMQFTQVDKINLKARQAKSNADYEKLIDDASVTFNAINLAVIDGNTVVGANLLGNTLVESSKFVVQAGDTVDMSARLFNTSLLALGQADIVLLKGKKGTETGTAFAEYEIVKRDSTVFLSALFLPLQTKYNFSFENLEEGTYYFAAAPSDGLNANVIGALTIDVTGVDVYESKDTINSPLVATPITGTLSGVTSVTEVTYLDQTAQENGGVFTLAGAYGTLTVNSNGTYSYKSDGKTASIGFTDTFRIRTNIGVGQLIIRNGFIDSEGKEQALNWSETNKGNPATVVQTVNKNYVETIQPTTNTAGKVTYTTNIVQTSLVETGTTFTSSLKTINGPESILVFRPRGNYNQKVTYEVYRQTASGLPDELVLSKEVTFSKGSLAQNGEYYSLTNLPAGQYYVKATRTADNSSTLQVPSHGLVNFVGYNPTGWTESAASTAKLPFVSTTLATDAVYRMKDARLYVEGTRIAETSYRTFEVRNSSGIPLPTLTTYDYTEFTGDYGKLHVYTDGKIQYFVTSPQLNLVGKKDEFDYEIVAPNGVRQGGKITIQIDVAPTFSNYYNNFMNGDGTLNGIVPQEESIQSSIQSGNFFKYTPSNTTSFVTPLNETTLQYTVGKVQATATIASTLLG